MSTWSSYQKPNVGLLFYKHIYKEHLVTKRLEINDRAELIINIPASDKTSPFDEFYTDLTETKAGDFEQIQNSASRHSFTLYTTYPGLLIGSGYQHDTKARGDFKIGFFFDHTTGQPVIPGSSVKGILRSLFELDIPIKKNEKAFTGQKSVDAIKFICDEIIEGLTGNADEQKKWEYLKSKINENSLRTLKVNIFGDGGDDGVRGVDVFYDSVVNIHKTGINNRVFSMDFITPHQNPLKNPIPLQFLKVLPNIGFDFKFILHDVDEWTSEIKEKLFKQILLTLGAGAKTNVGYGQFLSEKEKKKLEQTAALRIKEEKQKPAIEKNKPGGSERGINYKPKKDEKTEYNSLDKYKNIVKQPEQAEREVASDQWPDISVIKPKEGSITAKIIGIDGTNLIVQPYIKGLKDDYTLKINIGPYDYSPYKKGQEIQIQVTSKKEQHPTFVLGAKVLKNN